MAACAALLALGIRATASSPASSDFDSSEVQNPLRMNVHQVEGVTLVVDYAHNAAAYAAIIDTVRRLTAKRLIGVVSAPGDRRADDLAAIGRLCANGFDHVVIYEMDDQRRQPRGVTADAIARGTRDRARPDVAVEIVLDVREAIRHALAVAQPGDFVIVGCASHLSELRDALGSAPLSTVGVETFAARPAARREVGEPVAG